MTVRISHLRVPGVAGLQPLARQRAQRPADILVIIGPGLPRFHTDFPADRTREAEVRICGDGRSSLELSDLPSALASDAHVFVSCHGKLVPADTSHRTRHYMQFSPNKWKSTKAFVAKIRGRWPEWQGVLHLHSCYVGALRNEIGEGDNELGDCILYASSKRVLLSLGNEALSAMCRFVFNEKVALQSPSAMETFANAVFAAEECLTAFGKGFGGKLVVHAPKRTADLFPQKLEPEIESGRETCSPTAISRTLIVGDRTPKDTFLCRLRNEDGAKKHLTPSLSRYKGALLARITAGDMDHIEEWIEACRAVDAHIRDYDLARAALHSSDPLTTLRRLLDHGVTIDASRSDEDNSTILQSVDLSIGSAQQLVDFLIDRGCDINAFQHDGLTLLHRAAGAADQSGVRLLLDRGACIDAYVEGNSTPLAYACASYSSAQHAMVDFLIRQGADVNAGSSKPLHFAVASGDIILVDRLLKAGANVHARSARRETSLLIACRIDDSDQRLGVVQRLWTNGADPNGGEPVTSFLSAACQMTEGIRAADLEVVRLIISAVRPSEGKSEALMLSLDGALETKKYELARLLLEQRAVPSEDGISALFDASSETRLALIKALAEGGALTSIDTDFGGLPLLHWAAEFDDAALVAYLLEHGADKGLRAVGRWPRDRATDADVKRLLEVAKSRSGVDS